MSNVILTGVPHSDGMSDEMLAEAEAWFDKKLREFGAEIFEHSPAPLWLYHAITEIKKRRPPGGQRRERIATAVLQGIIGVPYSTENLAWPPHKAVAAQAVKYTDALIAELDKEIEG